MAVDFLRPWDDGGHTPSSKGKIAKTALVTTKVSGHLEIAFQIRPRLYDVFVEKPKPLIPRKYCFEVEERLDSNGNVITPCGRGRGRVVGDLRGKRSNRW